MTNVSFYYNRKEKDLFAIFPDIPFTLTPNSCTAYSHVGQHSSCHISYVLESRKAKPAEYADLLNELKQVGYDDLVIK